MCLPLAVDRPELVLGKGDHLGFEWVIVHNDMGFRCGYVRVKPGHPWHGKDYNDIEDDIDVHGGLTYARADKACGNGEDNGW